MVLGYVGVSGLAFGGVYGLGDSGETSTCVGVGGVGGRGCWLWLWLLCLI